MQHETNLIVTIVMGLVLAFALGFAASRLRLPPLVGYLLAGIVAGPFTPGFVADAGLAAELAEIGVILLMFGVGLHFSTADLLAVRWVAIPGAIGQIVLATLIGLGMALAWGWSLGAGLVLGLSLSVASTVVLLRALDERNAVTSTNGRIAVGWLIVEDLAMVLVLVLLPALAGVLGAPETTEAHGVAATSSQGGLADGDLLLTLAITLGKVALFMAVMLVAGPRVVPWLLGQVARSGSQELFTLSVLAVALGIALAASELFGVSFALGAFCAGVVLSKSDLSHRAAAESLPLQHAFSVLFFVSVGMLFDPSIVVREPMAVIGVLLLILIGKSLIAFVIVLLLGYPVATALTVSASLAQIGEFSFILAGLGLGLGLLPVEGRDLILAGALLSITLNPAVFAAVDPLTRWMASRRTLLGRGEPARRLRLQSLQRALAVATREAEAEAPAQVALQADEFAAKFPIFGDLAPELRAELLTLFKPRSAVPGERLIRAGDVASEVFFISSGAVEVSVGDQKIRLEPGDFFGEMALLRGGLRTADVTALDYCQFLTLSLEDFQAFLAKHPELRARIDEVVTRRSEMNRQLQAPKS